MRDAGGLVAGQAEVASSAVAAWTSAEPPPATMPSSTAARVAEMASSRRCFFSLSSTSVAAPTRMTQTPPASLASRSCSFSRSQSESVLLDLGLDLGDAAVDVLGVAGAVDDRGVVLGDGDAAGGAEHLEADLVELEADLLGDDLAAGEGGHVVAASPCGGHRSRAP